MQKTSAAAATPTRRLVWVWWGYFWILLLQPRGVGGGGGGGDRPIRTPAKRLAVCSSPSPSSSSSFTSSSLHPLPLPYVPPQMEQLDGGWPVVSESLGGHSQSQATWFEYWIGLETTSRIFWEHLLSSPSSCECFFVLLLLLLPLAGFNFRTLFFNLLFMFVALLQPLAPHSGRGVLMEFPPPRPHRRRRRSGRSGSLFAVLRCLCGDPSP